MRAGPRSGRLCDGYDDVLTGRGGRKGRRPALGGPAALSLL